MGKGESVGIYGRYVLPRLVDVVCGVRPIRRQRAKILGLASGRVLEIGIGSGLNIPFYDSNRVEKVWGLDPSAEMWALAAPAVANTTIPIEFLETGAEDIPLEDASVDTVVMTYSLCTIPSPARALGEMRRVLKDGGELVFSEHGAAPDASVRKSQDRVNRLWSFLAGGCNLNRDIPELLEEGGFHVERMETMYLPGWKPATFNYWGSARKRLDSAESAQP